MKTKWKKPNGKIIETNTENATIDACIELGWEPVKEKKKKKKE